MDIRQNTILVTVGPSNCGKTYFCQNYLIPWVNQNYDTYTYISSDDTRREIIGQNLDKYDDRMYECSGPAFDLLEAKIRAAVSYPVNQPVVIVDSTALSLSFRQSLIDIARNNEYHIQFVAFDYNTADYYSNSTNRAIVQKHVNKFKRYSIKELRDSKIPTTWIRGRDKFDIDLVKINDRANILEIPALESYCVVGDIHGCIDELEILYPKLSAFEHVILLGDLIDKNKVDGNTHKVLKFVLANQPRIKVIRGNHENFALAHWKSNSQCKLDAEILNKYFNDAVNASEDFKADLNAINLYDIIHTKDAIITHSPCQTKYLNKTHGRALREQRSLRYQLDKNEELKNKLFFLENEENACHKIHICGHVALDRAFVNQSNILCDTGAVYGNCLTAVYLQNRRPKFIKVQSKQSYCEGSVESLSFNKQTVSIPSEYLKKAQTILSKGIKYLSPTMSPAPQKYHDLESLAGALEYYRESGIETVSLQPKHMGSRAQVYLYEDKERTFAVSKNGFVIDRNTADFAINLYSLSKIQELFQSGAEEIILDTELMPWGALGENLIKNTFQAFSLLFNNEASYLQNAGLADKLEAMKATLNFEEFDSITKDAFIAKHGHHAYQNHKLYRELAKEFISPSKASTNGLKFHKQFAIYSKSGNIRYVPFDLLGYRIGRSWHLNKENPTDIFNSLRTEGPEAQTVKTTDQISAEKYFHGVCSQEYEGIVIKPIRLIPGVAPYLKVRNPEFLRLVYGPNYTEPNKLHKLLDRKNIRKKVNASINQFVAAQNILMAPEEDRERAIAEFLMAKDKTISIDPRF